MSVPEHQRTSLLRAHAATLVDSRGMGEVFAVGDRIEWWSDIDGGTAEPGDPAANKHTGTVASVHRTPTTTLRSSRTL
ncbi:hypothetical protein C5E46_35150 [Nocardia nova]|nr:hypothetical protein C5E46_35150 [Nocardia nova]